MDATPSDFLTKDERNTKLQTPSSREVPILKPKKQMPGQTTRRSVFVLGAGSFFGTWRLEFGAFLLTLNFSIIEMHP
jgi:hypothetical protein